MMVLSEMVRSRSSSFKRSFRKKYENSDNSTSEAKNTSTKQEVSLGR